MAEFSPEPQSHIISYFGRRMVDLVKIPAGSNLDIATGKGALLFPAAEAVGQGDQVRAAFSSLLRFSRFDSEWQASQLPLTRAVGC